MKKIIASLILGTALVYILSFSVVCAKNEAVCGKLVRIHIIANSDSPADQIYKMGVRDYIFSCAGEELNALKSKEEAVFYAVKNRERLEALAEEFLVNNGCNKEVRVYVGNENFPRKDYGEFVLPRGEYTALKIVIGEGKGKNYFCVMFPPMCVSAAVKINSPNEEALSTSELKALKKIKYKSAAAELLDKLFDF